MAEFFAQINLAQTKLDFLLAFLGGLFLSFSPCIYPLLPITIGIITEESLVYPRKGLVLSLVFVSGMALAYAFLGLIAALSGIYFGKISSHPWAQFLVGGVIIFFAFYALEFIKPPLPNMPFNKKLKSKTLFSVFFMGLVSALAISPCTAPVLGSILTYTASRKNILYALFLLISFAYGLGFILIIAGTFSGFLASLPKPGKWMLYLKRIMGLILLIWGLYFIFTGIRRLG